jgi:hypothetical protein
MEPRESSPPQFFSALDHLLLVTTYHERPDRPCPGVAARWARPRPADLRTYQSIISVYKSNLPSVGTSRESGAARFGASTYRNTTSDLMRISVYNAYLPAVGHHENSGLAASESVRPPRVAAASYPWALRSWESAHPILFASRDALKPELKQRPIFQTAPSSGSPGHLLGRSSSPVRP